MSATQPESGRAVATGVRAAYDAVARAYNAQLADELDGKPFDRGLLDGLSRWQARACSPTAGAVRATSLDSSRPGTPR